MGTTNLTHKKVSGKTINSAGSILITGKTLMSDILSPVAKNMTPPQEEKLLNIAGEMYDITNVAEK